MKIQGLAIIYFTPQGSCDPMEIMRDPRSGINTFDETKSEALSLAQHDIPASRRPHLSSALRFKHVS
jgi:hypothetical protein